MTTDAKEILSQIAPFDSLDAQEQDALAKACRTETLEPNQEIYAGGDVVGHMHLILSGEVRLTDANGETVALLGEGNLFGGRDIADGAAARETATVEVQATLLKLPAEALRALMDRNTDVHRYFARSSRIATRKTVADHDIATLRVADIMNSDPISVAPDAKIAAVAQVMQEKGISSLCVVEDDTLVGVVTAKDFAHRAVALGLSTDTPVSEIMTAGPITLPPNALGSDVLHIMAENHISHVPILDREALVGIITQTDLTRVQASTSAVLVSEIARAKDHNDLATATARIPKLLSQLVARSSRHEVTTRLVTDISDAATRRLLALAEEALGPPPVPYLWLACGSQGRREQTGVSDQDNCLMLADNAKAEDDAYFAALAKHVTDGLHAAGYIYCPGDMMASNPKWRQPVSVWRTYFEGWVRTPTNEAQMLASVMFDLRPISGDFSLFTTLHEDTLKIASNNSIFVAHMTSNALKHAPPLGPLRGLATVRSGEYRQTIDLKKQGVVPIVDLGRIYALQGAILPINTRARIEIAGDDGVISPAGTRDLLDAYDVIAEIRLEHQARLIKGGEAPDNFLRLVDLSGFERSHLRDAFLVIKTMQSALVSAMGGRRLG